MVRIMHCWQADAMDKSSALQNFSKDVSRWHPQHISFGHCGLEDFALQQPHFVYCAAISSDMRMSHALEVSGHVHKTRLKQCKRQKKLIMSRPC
eukprot:3285925-Amphidinium_carterae.1